MNKPKLPPHIAFVQSLNTKLSFNLSNSCAQTLSVAQLCQLAASSIEQQSLSYASLRGDEALRQAIADFHLQLNRPAPISADNVLTFCGAQEALAAIYQSVLSPGDEVVVFTPSYPSLVTMAAQYGAKAITLPLGPDNGWQMDIDRLAEVVNDNTRLIVVNSPHNPTGSVLTSEQTQRVLAIARQHHCYLLADDVSQASNYHKLELAHDYLSYDKAIVVNVMSKSFGLAGLRIGWAISSNSTLLEQMLAIKASGSICCSAVDEQLALMALQQSDHILKHNNQIIKTNIDHFSRFVANHGELFSWQPPQAGIMALVHLNLPTTIDNWAKQLAGDSEILLLPAHLFGQPGNYFRLGLGQENFPLMLEKLAQSNPSQ